MGIPPRTRTHIMGCMQSVPLPDPVAKFFHGKPMTPELQASLEAVLSDDFELRFVGEFVPEYAKPVVLDRSKFPGALKNLQASFPNLTFAPTKSVKQKANGSWAALTLVSGDHTGEPFAPMPHLEKIPTSQKNVKIGPEEFALFLTEDGTKINKVEITPQHEGAEVGPPGFYRKLGGELKPPPA